MKKQILALSPFMLAAAMVAQVHAQTPNKVGVIQIQAAIAGTKDGQKAIADLDNRLAPKKKDLERKQAEIRDLQDKLQRGGTAMSEAAKQDLAKTIDQKTKVFNREMQDAQDEADAEQRKLIDELGQKLMQVIDKFAQANGYSVILDVSNPNTPVLYASNTIEITKEVVELYDKSASTLTAPKTPAATKPAPPATKPPTTTPPVKKLP